MFATRCPQALPSNPGAGGATAACQFLQLGPYTAILRHQAAEGFAHVEEQTLEEVHDKILNIPKPVADDGARRKDELALSLMKALHPTWTRTEAMKALSRAFIMENPDSPLEPKMIPKQCLMELVTPNEASTINEAFERATKLKNKTRGLQTRATQNIRRESLQAFPQLSRRQEEGAALESSPKP